MALPHGLLICDGRALNGMSVQARSALGLVRTFQTPKVFEQMTVLGNVMAGACKLRSGFLIEHLFRMNRSRADTRRIATLAEDVSARFELQELFSQPAHARPIPVHAQLIELGFIKFVAAEAKARGERAWLFSQVAPGTTGARAYSKWFGRYIGAQGVTDTAKVFHSFRHGFTDALRVAGVGEDVSRALVGHTQGGVLGRYGAKEMAARYRHRLAEAIASVASRT